MPFNAYAEKTGEYKNVKAGTTQFKFNSEEGSWDSLRLIKAFLDTKRLDCLRSDFVQALADYKFRAAIMTIGLLNLASVALIMGMAFSTETRTRQALTGFFLLLNFFSTVFELLQINSGDYFKLFRNYLDIPRIALGYVWGVVSLTSEFENLNSPNYLTLVTSFLFWLEGINAFKVIDSTRYYIWLIQEVIKDTASFLLILVYFIFGYCGLTGITLSSNLSDTLTTSYKLLLGDFDDSDFDNVQWILFVLGSVLNLVVMLNLLIAIISESFDKITFRRVESDTTIKLQLILEIENCMFWKRNRGQETYLHFLQEYGGEEQEEEWESRVRKLYDDSQNIKERIKTMQETTRKEIQETKKEINEKLEILLKRIQ